jgi:hypothetical protein
MTDMGSSAGMLDTYVKNDWFLGIFGSNCLENWNGLG